MKRIIDWVKESNHYYHIGLLATLTLVIMSVGAFEFGADGLGINAWQTVKFSALVGIVIEVYQFILAKVLNAKNTFSDLLADVIGLVLGVGSYILLALASPYTAIALMCISLISVIAAFVVDKWRCILLMVFLGCLIIGFSLFVYA